MKISFPLLAVLSLAGVVNANAAIITYEDRIANNTVSNTDYQASWNAQTSAISTRVLSDFTGVTLDSGLGYSYTPNQAGFSYLNVSFSVATAGSNWAFQLAPDAGYGGALYLDGTLLNTKTYDLWWGGNWSGTSQILSDSGLNLTAGNHTLTAYWAENCCNGPQGARFSSDGTNFQSLSALNNPVATPLPTALLFVAPALAGVFGFSRRKAANGLQA